MDIKPTRDESKPMELYADLDAIIAEPIYFKLHGKRHAIKAISTKEFFKVSTALANVWDLTDKNQITAKELVDRYTELFSSICSTITREDIENMEQAQAVGLLQLVMDAMTGKAHVADYEKKKTLIRESSSAH